MKINNFLVVDAGNILVVYITLINIVKSFFSDFCPVKAVKHIVLIHQLTVNTGNCVKCFGNDRSVKIHNVFFSGGIIACNNIVAAAVHRNIAVTAVLKKNRTVRRINISLVALLNRITTVVKNIRIVGKPFAFSVYRNRFAVVCHIFKTVTVRADRVCFCSGDARKD